MSKAKVQSHILNRIKELNDEMLDLVDDARQSKAKYEELMDLYNIITSDSNFNQEEANKIIERAQACFDENQESLLRFNEKQAAVKELEGLLEA